jgi:hypothetical protein
MGNTKTKRFNYSTLNKAIKHTGLCVKGGSDCFSYGCGTIPLFSIETGYQVETIYINRINHLTLEQWVAEAEAV